MKLNKLVLSVAIAATFSTSAFSANSQGKPFIAINEQIVEVQGAVSTLEDQVAELIGKVDSIEERLSANEKAIVDLMDKNDALESLIAGAYTSISDIEGEISVLSGAMDTNAGLISSLQSAIISIQNGQIDLEESLQGQIDKNLELIGMLEGNIDAINNFLETDQHITEGTCPDGEYVIGHTENSVSCAPVNGGGNSSISGYLTFARSASWGRNAQAYCYQQSDIATGGGFNAIQTEHSVRRSTPTGKNGWTVELTGNNRDVQAYVICLRVQ